MNESPKFTTLTSRVVPLLVNDVDTDQIIPARYLKVTEKSGLGAHLFADWRFNEDGSAKPEFVLNRSEHRGAQILLAGDNFGCGSSREHAPWALFDYGFRAVISTSFADIFRNNALKNGLLPVQVDRETHELIAGQIAKKPESRLSISLPDETVELPSGKRVTFPIDSFSKHCLVNGVDELGYLLQFEQQIKEFELRHD